MKVLCTGAAGFIGSHLTERLLKEGHTVIAVDDLSEGKLTNLPLKNPRLIFRRRSITADLTPLFAGVDWVFHLAAKTRPLESIEKVAFYHEININGTLKILLSCRKQKVKRLIFASSGIVYGDQKVFPSSETAKPNPSVPYGLHKLMGEQFCQLFETLYGLETNCLRFFNVYGPRMNPDSKYSALIPGFIKKFKRGLRPAIFGDGKQTRDFIYIDDLVEGIVRAAKCKAHHEIINLGSGQDISVNRVAKSLQKALKTTIEPIHTDPVIEPRRIRADIRKAKRLLGWTPKISIEQGIRKLI